MVNHERTFFNGFYAFPMTLSWISSCTLRGLFQTLSAFHTPRKTELHCVELRYRTSVTAISTSGRQN
jgi:hypothetical protein